MKLSNPLIAMLLISAAPHAAARRFIPSHGPEAFRGEARIT